jgi:hypothetical protein
MDKKTTYTQSQKKHIMKWRTEHKIEYNKYMNDYHKDYYVEHADKFRKKRMGTYYYNKECQIFRNIEI